MQTKQWRIRMADEFRLHAKVQPQLWVRDMATDAGPTINFDAHDAMLSLNAAVFARVADEVLNRRGHDYDDVALNAGVIDDWLAGSKEATFYADIDKDDFSDWLDSIELSEEEAVDMDDATLQDLKARLNANTLEVSESPTFKV